MQASRLVRFCLSIQALGLLGSIFLIVPALILLHSGEGSTAMLWTLMLIGPVFGTLPTIAWYRLNQGRPSGRAWALAASIQNIFILLIGIQIWIFLGLTSIWLFYLWSGISGILGLIAFWHNGGRAEKADDPEPPKIEPKGKDYVGQGLALGIVWLSNQCWKHWAASHHLSYPELPLLLVQLEIALLLTTFGHELGHMAAGWVSGKILCSFQLGPICGEIRNGQWVFDLKLRHFNGGSVAMVAPDLKNLRSRKAFSLMGGPVASLTIASVCIVITLLAPGRTWQAYWLLFAMTANFSIAGFLVNLIPLKPESLYSDGAQLYQVLTNGPWADVHFAFEMVSSSTASAVRARDYDVKVIHKAADSIADGERGLLLRLYACIYYLDIGEVARALVSLDEAEALWDKRARYQGQDILTEFVFVNAFYKRDLASAELWWMRIEAQAKVEEDADYWRARTALLWLKGDRTSAWQTWRLGNELAQKLPESGVTLRMRANFAKLNKALEEPDRPLSGSLQALSGACEEARPLPYGQGS